MRRIVAHAVPRLQPRSADVRHAVSPSERRRRRRLTAAAAAAHHVPRSSTASHRPSPHAHRPYVHHRAHDAAVPERFLHEEQVARAVVEPHGEGVPQSVRRDRPCDARLLLPRGEAHLELTRAEWFAGPTLKDRPRGAAAQELAKELSDRGRQEVTDLPIALRMPQQDLAASEVNVRDVQPER